MSKQKIERSPVEEWTLERIIPYENNAKLHPDTHVDQIAASIEEFTFLDPVAVDEKGFLLEGHGRLLAAKQRGDSTIPVIQVTGLTEAQKRAYRLAHNKLTTNTGFDTELLKIDFEFLKESDFDLDLTGFDPVELNFEEDGGGEQRGTRRNKDDAVNPEEVELRVGVGDLVLMGRHRLIVGDCTDPVVIERLMDGKKAQICITDPPYNVDYDPERRTSSFSEDRLKNPLGKIKNDVMSDASFRTFLDKVYFQINVSLDSGCPIYIFHADAKGHHFRNAFVAQDWNMQSCLIWKKTVLAFGRADYQWIHEPVLYGWKEGASHRYYGDRRQTTVIECPTPHYDKDNCDTEGYIHPTQKPTLILETFLNNSSQEGDIVIDFFGGSGSTLIACEATNRSCYTSELDPRFASAIVMRWEEYTQKIAQVISLPIQVNEYSSPPLTAIPVRACVSEGEGLGF
ncbi:MAG: site-specific DNA-methyltransferase [Nostoc sp.]|uniref:site-specific DNA-methyltransferase n=1 Tax=Nostoc sp. TaxID=1180 RepID=UPI002FF05205